MPEKYEAVATAIIAAGMASECADNRTEWKFCAEFLEYGDDVGDCQLIVNAEKIGAPYTGQAGRRLAFNEDEIDPCQDRLYELAEAIATAFNAIDGITEEDEAAWYVHSECNWWHGNGEETDNNKGVTTIQWCIFNG